MDTTAGPLFFCPEGWYKGVAELFYFLRSVCFFSFKVFLQTDLSILCRNEGKRGLISSPVEIVAVPSIAGVWL